MSSSQHDAVIYDARDIYREAGFVVHINPGNHKNYMWGGYYIDVIVESPEGGAWLIEVETDHDVFKYEAKEQWKKYDNAYQHWYLAVPAGTENKAKSLMGQNHIQNCLVVTWQKEQDGSYAFWDLPGL